MRHINRVEVRAAQRARLGARRSHKHIGCDRYRRHAEAFKLGRVVQTARRARPSIRQRLDNSIAAGGDQVFDDCCRRWFGKRRLGRANDLRNAVPFLEHPLEIIEEYTAAGFADIEQADCLARKRGESRRRRALNAHGFIE